LITRLKERAGAYGVAHVERLRCETTQAGQLFKVHQFQFTCLGGSARLQVDDRHAYASRKSSDAARRNSIERSN
jgi:hypothetical protein